MIRLVSVSSVFLCLLFFSCQKEAEKTESQEETTEEQSDDVWEDVPLEVPDKRPLQIRYTEVRTGLDSAWSNIRQADSIKLAEVRALEKELPKLPRFKAKGELEALSQYANWFIENPMTKETIAQSEQIDRYDQQLDGFISIADSLLSMHETLDPKTAKRLVRILEIDREDLVRRNAYESLVRKHNKILETQRDSLEILGFENLKPESLFQYGNRVQ